MPTCRLCRITCYEQEDWTGDDHPYILVNSRRVWGPRRTDEGQTHEINLDVQFNHRVKLTLMEDDRWEEDDQIGSHIITRGDISEDEKELKFREDDANYSIWVLVSP
ncbi:hypothetical protein F4Z99_07985 [Candidatus Poribacteria bacterium]|nr:hypothetical protein [Candidatus Poribacteria bacterium]